MNKDIWQDPEFQLFIDESIRADVNRKATVLVIAGTVILAVIVYWITSDTTQAIICPAVGFPALGIWRYIEYRGYKKRIKAFGIGKNAN